MICRFICGLFASAPLTLAGGTISDIWDNNERGFAIALFAAAPYGGPVLGPIIGGFVGEKKGWRWMIWINMILAALVAVLTLTIPETFAPALLKKRAARLRKETGNPNITTEQELFKASLSDVIVETLIRPFRKCLLLTCMSVDIDIDHVTEMLATEPILLLMSLYIALIYGLLVSYMARYAHLSC